MSKQSKPHTSSDSPSHSSWLKKYIKNQSRCRRLQNQWLMDKVGVFPEANMTLDLGGVRGADYHQFLGIPPERLLIWNQDLSTNPNAIVNLDDVGGLPSFPENVNQVIAYNLLEHLYRPFSLLEWICEHLPSGGRLIIAVPYHYPIHPSPQDYWRFTPQVFERFFQELVSFKSIQCQWTIDTLSADFRDGISPLTSTMFKSGLAPRIMASLLEGMSFVVSKGIGLVKGKSFLEAFAAKNPSSLGVQWKKL